MTEKLAQMMTTENLILNLHTYREMGLGRGEMPGYMTTRDAWAAVKVCETELAKRGVVGI